MKITTMDDYLDAVKAIASRSSVKEFNPLRTIRDTDKEDNQLLSAEDTESELYKIVMQLIKDKNDGI